MFRRLVKMPASFVLRPWPTQRAIAKPTRGFLRGRKRSPPDCQRATIVSSPHYSRLPRPQALENTKSSPSGTDPGRTAYRAPVAPHAANGSAQVASTRGVQSAAPGITVSPLSVHWITSNRSLNRPLSRPRFVPGSTDKAIVSTTSTGLKLPDPFRFIHHPRRTSRGVVDEARRSTLGSCNTLFFFIRPTATSGFLALKNTHFRKHGAVVCEGASCSLTVVLRFTEEGTLRDDRVSGRAPSVRVDGGPGLTAC